MAVNFNGVSYNCIDKMSTVMRTLYAYKQVITESLPAAVAVWEILVSSKSHHRHHIFILR